MPTQITERAGHRIRISTDVEAVNTCQAARERGARFCCNISIAVFEDGTGGSGVMFYEQGGVTLDFADVAEKRETALKQAIDEVLATALSRLECIKAARDNERAVNDWVSKVLAQSTNGPEIG